MTETVNWLPTAVIFGVIAVNLIVSLFGFRALRGGGESTLNPHDFLFSPYEVANGRNLLGWALCHFSHAGWLHLGFNMLAFISFVGGVIEVLGPWQMLLVYMVAGLGSDAVVYLLRKDDPNYRCLGASGSVFGVVMAAVVLDPTISVIFLFIPVPIPGPVFMLIYAAISVYLISRRTQDGISHEGHLGGTLAGLVITALLAPRGLAPLGDWFLNLLS